MKYDFDTVVPRRGTDSLKWELADEDVLPMWVADMDFKTAPPVIEALVRRCEHGIFGYTNVPEKYYEATIDWFNRRHGWKIGRDQITPIPGIVPALTLIIKALCEPTDKVIIQTPVYNCFFSSTRNAGRELLCNPLLREGNTFYMDFEDLEKKASDPQAKLLLLCNPHNPVGRVWTRDELTRLGEICLRHNVFVLADEIHCELVFPGVKYTPFASISEEFSHNSITCNSPSKAFNIAGLQISNIVTERADWRRKIRKEMSVNEMGMVSPLGVDALVAAYNEGEEWLEELNTYISENYRFMKEFCAKELPLFPVTEMEGTYLVWMDCSALGEPSDALADELERNGRLWLNAGTMYGEEGRNFLRWNIACPRSTLLEGLTRFRDFVK